MIRLWHAPFTRSNRIVWLLEELGLPYALEPVEFRAPERAFEQQSPYGKVPALEDEGVTLFESGAILEYLIERYGQGRLAPAVGDPERGPYLQWVHFAEATLMPPLGQLAWNKIFKPEEQRIAQVVEESEGQSRRALDVLEQALEDGREHLLASGFCGADVMMGYSLQSATWFGVLGADHPRTQAYFERLSVRPAFEKAFASLADR
jgi:glutathione S-transferase